MMVSRPFQKKAFLLVSVAALLVVGGESFVQAKLFDRFGKTMCFSSKKDEQTETQTSEKDFEVQTFWNFNKIQFLSKNQNHKINGT